MATKPESHTLDHTIPLRITSPMKAEMKHAASQMHYSDLNALRTAAAIGFKVLRAYNYDIAAVLAESYVKARKQKRKTRK